MDPFTSLFNVVGKFIFWFYNQKWYVFGFEVTLTSVFLFSLFAFLIIDLIERMSD